MRGRFVRTVIIPAILMLAVACHAFRDEAPAVLRGRLVLEVDPNPIQAVSIEDFTVEAVAFRTVRVQSQTYPVSFITERGYSAAIEAGKFLRFSFTKRWSLPSRLLLSGASARVRARTLDANGARGETFVRVDVELSPRENGHKLAP